MRKIIFELCAETMDACVAAREGGAHRIEICSSLSEGGLTPSRDLVSTAIERTGLPVHILVRPRSGNFLYSNEELSVMAEEIVCMKQLGAAGVVLGLLKPDGSVDVATTRVMVKVARPMAVTFHRAFDATPSLSEALEDVIATGCDRVLTSGGERDVVAGASRLTELVRQSKDRIQIAVGGGLSLQNAASLSRLTRADHFHGSLRRRVTREGLSEADSGAGTPNGFVVDAEEVRSVISRLQTA